MSGTGPGGITLFAAPTMVRRLAEHPDAGRFDHPGLKTIVYGGGPMYQADLERALAAFGHRLAQIYGQGESPMTITALAKAMHADTGHPRHRERLRLGRHGASVVEVDGRRCRRPAAPPGELGEVLVRGDGVMRGYWQDPDGTAATLRGGWLHTGDLGVLDADGFLTLKDRSKDLIISGGSNIYPREVEEVLLRHPRVAEAAWSAAPTASGERRWSPSSSRRRARCDAGPSSMRSASSTSRASSGRRTTASSRACRRTTTARC